MERFTRLALNAAFPVAYGIMNLLDPKTASGHEIVRNCLKQSQLAIPRVSPGGIESIDLIGPKVEVDLCVPEQYVYSPNQAWHPEQNPRLTVPTPP